MSTLTVMFLAAAVAQAEPPARSPGTDPGVTNPSVENRALEQLKKQLNTDPVLPVKAPASQATPGAVPVPGDEVVVPGAKVYPEGTFLTGRTGTLLRVRSGDVILVPVAAREGEAPEPPMILHPCALLTQMMGAAEAGTTQVTLSGQVFQYRTRHYLLPTVFSMAAPAPAPAPTATQPAPSEPPAAPGAAPAADSPPESNPAVTDLIRELEAERAPRAMDPARTADREEAAPKAITAPEGELLVGRRARLVRLEGARGAFAAAFDNDPNSPAGGTMVFLPCRALERLEAVAAQQGERTSFKVSGRVFVHNGRNYILPVLIQPQRSGDVAPMQ